MSQKQPTIDARSLVTGLLFTPPSVVIEADLAWLLRSAFAELPFESVPEDAPRSVQLARRLELSGRIAQRWKPTAQLRSSDVFRAFEADQHNNLAVEALLVQALDRIGTLAEGLAAPVIALKFAALRLSGVLVPGSRVAGDLDLFGP